MSYRSPSVEAKRLVVMWRGDEIIHRRPSVRSHSVRQTQQAIVDLMRTTAERGTTIPNHGKREIVNQLVGKC